MKYVGPVVTAVYDAIEDCISTMSIVGGKQLLETFYLCCVLLAISVAGRLLNIWLFINWQECLVATLFTGTISAVNYMNKAGLEKVKGSVLTKVAVAAEKAKAIKGKVQSAQHKTRKG